MTRVTTITEFDIPGGKAVNLSNTDGASGTLVYKDDEAAIVIHDVHGETDKYHVHPEDALGDFLSQFLEF